MKLTPEQYKLVEREWQARRHSYSTKLVHDAEEQQLLFRHSPDADMYVYVPCPVCGERRYTVFHERTAIRMRTVFGNRPLTAAAHRDSPRPRIPSASTARRSWPVSSCAAISRRRKSPM